MKVSNGLKKIIFAARFCFVRVVKTFFIFFKRSRRLKKVTLSYYRFWRFSNAYLVIDIKFKNAVWYKIEGIQKTDFSHPLVLNLKHIKADSLQLEVFGLWQKKIFLIKLAKEAELYTQRFSTKINKIKELMIVRQNKLVAIPDFAVLSQTAGLSVPDISVVQPKITFKYSKI